MPNNRGSIPVDWKVRWLQTTGVDPHKDNTHMCDHHPVRFKISPSRQLTDYPTAYKNVINSVCLGGDRTKHFELELSCGHKVYRRGYAAPTLRARCHTCPKN